MDGESGLVIGCGQRERKRSYRDFLLDSDDLEERPSRDPEFSTAVIISVDCREEPYSAGLPPACQVQASGDGWRDGAGEQYGTEDDLLHAVSPAEGTIEEPGSPLADYWVYLNDKHDSFESTLTSHDDFAANPVAHHRPYPITAMPTSQTTTDGPVNYTEGGTSLSGPMTDRVGVGHGPSERGDVSSADLVVVNAAAHLHLMGESLALIGHELQETDKAVCVHSSVSLLMDSMLCALVPLVSLTSLLPGLRGVQQHSLADAMENIGYMMPGL